MKAAVIRTVQRHSHPASPGTPLKATRMMTFLGYGIRTTDAIYDDHLMVSDGYLFMGCQAMRRIYDVLREQHRGWGDATEFLHKAIEQSENLRRSVPC
jgi:hypothetical protein